MSLVVNTKNIMLGALTITSMSAHTAFPGLTGTAEVTGTPYVRQNATFSAASGGSRVLASPVTFAMPSGVTVNWLGLWNGATYLGYSPNAANPKEFVAAPSTDTFTCPAHGYSNGQKVVIYGDTMPTGLTEGVTVYVINATTDTFQIAATSGGAVLPFSTVGGPGLVVSSIVEEYYGSGGNHTIASWVIGLSD